MEIQKDNTKELWKEALNYILEKGTKIKDRYGRYCKEVMHLNLVLTGFADIEMPIEKISSFGKWVYPRIGEIKAIMLESNVGNSYEYSYGDRVFSFHGFNQMDNYVIPILKKDINSRRAVISLWDPLKDPSKNQAPGLVFLDFKVRDNKINLFALIRSNDLFIGWPANLYQLYVLANYVSKKLELEIGSITTMSTSAHVFLDNLDEIKEVI